jgi:hypothetical protein
METTDQLFTWLQIRDAIGLLADTGRIEAQFVRFARAAVTGLCPTFDEGETQFGADVSGCNLFNVGTEELIWPWSPAMEGGDYILLPALTNADLWNKAREIFEESQPVEWTAFVWRIAVPLSIGLGFVGAWSNGAVGEFRS